MHSNLVRLGHVHRASHVKCGPDTAALRKGEGTHRAATARSACLPVILEESWADRAAWEDSRRRADHSMPGDAHTNLRSRRSLLSSGLRSSITKRNETCPPRSRETRIPSVTSRRLSFERSEVGRDRARQVQGIQIQTRSPRERNHASSRLASFPHVSFHAYFLFFLLPFRYKVSIRLFVLPTVFVLSLINHQISVCTSSIANSFA